MKGHLLPFSGQGIVSGDKESYRYYHSERHFCSVFVGGKEMGTLLLLKNQFRIILPRTDFVSPGKASLTLAVFF